MADPLCDFIDQLRKKGHVPVGVIAFDVEGDLMRLYVFSDTNLEEANALLEKIGMEVTPEKDRIP